jgi:alkylation response protein AidB-like acyl-CoA dehydrogenase
MDLALTDTQRVLRDSVRQFVQQEAPTGTLTELDSSAQPWESRWLRTLAATGWLGLFVPASLGGADASVMDAAVLLEELGRGPVPGPVFPSSVVAALLLRAATPTPERDELLEGIGAGTSIVIPALRETGASWRGAGSARAQLGSGGQLSGTKIFVACASAATHFLVSLSGDDAGRSQFAVVPADAAGVRIRPLTGFLHGSYEVDFAAAAATTVLTVPEPGELDEALAPGLVALAAYQAGGCAAVLDMSIRWSNTREQFGSPIGRFQRVQDHIVRILNATDAARWTAYEAAWAVHTGQPAGPARAHLAAAVASDSYLEAANAAHEVHAGIGSDPKFGLTLYTRQARTLFDFLGSPDWHRARMAERLGWLQ